ncbi:hypothetical protein D3C78_1630210 [compost metagenome]
MVGALFPRGLVADFRRAQQAGAMAGIAMLGNDVFRCLGTATPASRSGDFHALALFALDTDLADWLKALGNFVVGRSLSADSPEGQYGCWYGQHFHN